MIATGQYWATGIYWTWEAEYTAKRHPDQPDEPGGMDIRLLSLTIEAHGHEHAVDLDMLDDHWHDRIIEQCERECQE